MLDSNNNKEDDKNPSVSKIEETLQLLRDISKLNLKVESDDNGQG